MDTREVNTTTVAVLSGDVGVNPWNVVGNYLESTYGNDVFVIPHPNQGRGYNQVVGNYYSRIKVTIRFAVKISVDEIIRIVVCKNNGHIDPLAVPDRDIFVTNYGIFLYHFLSTKSVTTTSYDLEILYDHFACKSSSEYYLQEFVYEVEESLNINSHYNQLYVMVLGMKENVVGPTTSKYMCFAETKFIP